MRIPLAKVSCRTISLSFSFSNARLCYGLFLDFILYYGFANIVLVHTSDHQSRARRAVCAI